MSWLLGSYQRWLGRPLTSELSGQALEAWLYRDAPFCLVAHDGAVDPRFLYANRAAQRCFEYEWHEFVGLPSRLSAEPDRRRERDQLLARCAQHGFAEGYRGLRIAKSGRRFWIENVTIWNVLDSDGLFRGQAAVYRDITPA